MKTCPRVMENDSIVLGDSELSFLKFRMSPMASTAKFRIHVYLEETVRDYIRSGASKKVEVSLLLSHGRPNFQNEDDKCLINWFYRGQE